MAPGPRASLKFSLEWMLTLDSFYKREVPSRSVTSRDGELLIAGLHRFDLHRDLFHRVIERGLRRLLTGEAQFKRGVGRPHTSPSRECPASLPPLAPTGWRRRWPLVVF